MRTIDAIENKEKKERIAKETMEIYAPLADRMGMNRIRDELEDLSFGVLNTKAKKMIKDRLDDIKDKNLLNFKNLSEEFQNILKEKSLKSKIFGREKQPFLYGEKFKKKNFIRTNNRYYGF